jgi:dTDP-4-amino-4,6-dideoxygalactose transaminase
MQSSKIMTAGEGGLLICRDQEMAYRVTSIIDCGRPHDPAGEILTMGANYRLGELQAALLNVAIERFPAQAAQREGLAAYMDEALSEVPGVRVLPRDPRHTTRSFYRYIFAIDPETFGADHDVVCAALHMEGIPCWEGYEAMHHYELFQPQTSKLPVPSAFPDKFKFQDMNLPEATRACEHEAVWFDESIFRTDMQGVDDAVSALKKIQGHLSSNQGAVSEIKRLLKEYHSQN